MHKEKKLAHKVYYFVRACVCSLEEVFFPALWAVVNAACMHTWQSDSGRNGWLTLFVCTPGQIIIHVHKYTCTCTLLHIIMYYNEWMYNIERTVCHALRSQIWGPIPIKFMCVSDGE